eukprot:g44492.t1
MTEKEHSNQHENHKDQVIERSKKGDCWGLDQDLYILISHWKGSRGLVTKAIDEGRAVDVVYMDFSKAFNKVPHDRLIQKIKMHGI